MAWGTELGGRYETWPKEREKKTFTIKKIRKVEEKDHAFNFKTKAGGNQGYRYIFETDSGKELTLGNYALAVALRLAGVEEGCTFTVNHAARGVYEVKVLNSPEKEVWTE